MSPDKEARVEDLHTWWMDRAGDEANRVVEKAVEYGNNSMVEVGHQMAKMQGRVISDEEAAEMACYFYIVGKMGRWSDSLARGERVSGDTLYDVGVYVRMAQRIREAGGWPGAMLTERVAKDPYDGGGLDAGLDPDRAVVSRVVHNHDLDPSCPEYRTSDDVIIGGCLATMDQRSGAERIN